MPLFASNLDNSAPQKTLPHKRQIALTKERRRILYETHQAFEGGRLSRTGEPILYSPTPDNGWVMNGDYATSHEALGKYLRRYGLI